MLLPDNHLYGGEFRNYKKVNLIYLAAFNRDNKNYSLHKEKYLDDTLSGSYPISYFDTEEINDLRIKDHKFKILDIPK